MKWSVTLFRAAAALGSACFVAVAGAAITPASGPAARASVVATDQHAASPAAVQCPDPGPAGSAQAGLITQLCNIDGFLNAPVDPVTGSPLPGSPYSGTTDVLATYLSALSSETAGGQALSPTALNELTNVVDLLSLVVPVVSQTAAQTPSQIAQDNDQVNDGLWGISYQISNNITDRFFSAAGSVLNFAETVAGDKLGDEINDLFDGWIITTFNQVAVGLLTAIAQEFNLEQSIVVSMATDTVQHWVAGALDLQAAAQAGEQTITDILLAASAFELDLVLPSIVKFAEHDETAPAATAVADLLSEYLDGPASVAASRNSALDSLYSNPLLGDIATVLEAIPFEGIGDFTAVTVDTAQIGGDIGNVLVDTRYLYDPVGVPVPGTLADTMLFGWSQAVIALLGMSPPPPSDANSLTATVPDTGGCQTTAGEPTCEAGSLIGITGMVADSGTPVPGAQVQLSASAGSLTADSVSTAADGTYTAGLILPATVGQTVTITASIPGSAATPATTTVTIGAGPPYALDLAAPTTVTAGTSSVPVTAFLADKSGNGIPGVDVDLSTSAGTVSPSSGATDSGGIFQATVSIPAGVTSVTLTPAAPSTGLPIGTPLTISVVPASAPVIASFTTSKPDVPAAGGSVTLTGSATGASSCAVTVAPPLPGFPASPACSGFSLGAAIAASSAGEQAYTFQLSATGPGGTSSQEVTVTQGAPLTVGTAMPTGVDGQPYDANIPISGGFGPYSVSTTSGTPPAGLSLSTGGVLTGTPTGAGSAFAVQVTDAIGDTATASITVNVQTQPVNTGLQTVSFEQEALNGTYQVSNCAADPWSVTLNGVTESCSQPGNGPVFINFTEPDGTYPFTVTAPAGYDATPASGAVTVTGSQYVQLVAFKSSSGPPSWTESALSGQSVYVSDESLACTGQDCYERGVAQTSPTSYGLVLWSSTDGGVKWSPTPFPLPGVNLTQSCDGGYVSNNDPMTGCLVAFGSTAYALGPEGSTSGTDTSAFWYTTDNGQTWDERDIASGLAGDYLACANTDDCYVFGNSGGNLVLYSTSNAGQQWARQQLPGQVEDVSVGNDSALACPAANTCILATTSGAIETMNSGSTWKPVGPAGASAPVTCPSSQVCWIAAGSQIWVSDDQGADWSQEGTLPVAPAQLGCLDQSLCIAVGSDDNIYVNTYGTTWVKQSLPNVFVPYAAALSPAQGLVLAIDQSNQVATWQMPISALVSTATSTAITGLTNAPVAGQPVTVGVQVTAASPGSGVPAPAGNVTVTDGAGQACLAVLTGSAGLASGSCQLTEPAGTYRVTAGYGGDANFTSSASPSATSLTVAKAASSVSITSVTPNPVVGQPIAVDVQVAGSYTAPGDPVPSGRVLVSDGATTCSASLSGSAGLATGSCQFTARTGPGSTEVTASYGGDQNFGSSVTPGPARVTVVKAASTTTLTLSVRTVAYGSEETLRLSVTVSPQVADTPSGEVIIASGKTTICKITLSGAKGHCAPLPSALRPGRYKIIASYAGNAEFNPSASPPAELTVSKAS